jgi:hypothetical protein
MAQRLVLIVIVAFNQHSKFELAVAPERGVLKERIGRYCYLAINPLVLGESIISSVIRSHSTTDTAGALCMPSVKTLRSELTVLQIIAP